MTARRAVATVAALLCGCATVGNQATAPVSNEDARHQIASLERRIADLAATIGQRSEVGTAEKAATIAAEMPSAPKAGAPSPVAEPAPSVSPPNPTPTAARPPAPMEPPPSEPATSRPEPPPGDAASTPTAGATSRRRSRRCRKVDEVAHAICDAASRICELADRLAEPDAARSCSRSRDDCARAVALADRCPPP